MFPSLVGLYWPCSASVAMGQDAGHNELTAHHDDEDGSEWDFSDGQVDSYFDLHARLRRDFDTTPELAGIPMLLYLKTLVMSLAWHCRT